jgi:hypothetical protein
MLGLTLICVSFLALVLGTVAHFRILCQLESAGVRVKYFANIWDNLRAYKTYRDLAVDRRWPMWPSYAVFAVYVGVLLAGVSFFFGSPLLQIGRWLK